jgi:2-polyprenyl-3-methyl-5-hydroxy-6-metoxy-1,4-benzoquinol methylase
VAEQEVLEVEEALVYWDQRHRAQDELRSGGDMSFDHAANEVFYALRLAWLAELAGVETAADAPRQMLDAGCGKGYFARGMGRFGHRVDGIDASPFAIEACLDLSGPSESYAVATLDQWSPPYLYDVVYCIDVVFHIMDDALWAESMHNLASLVRLGGQLIVVDHGADEDRVWRNYQKTRARSRYDDLVTGHGLTRRGDFVPYRYRQSPAGFHHFIKDS